VINVNLTTLAAFVGELAVLIGAITPVWVSVRRIKDGTKCQLRSEMLRIYYRNLESKTIRQYEYENFVFLYEAYKSLRGNSFIDKIWSEVQEWKVIR
jgi:hypothetical protein